jgi:hypothetical protein
VSDDSTYPDPWGPGGKFIESGLHEVEEPSESEPEEDNAEPDDD